MMRTMSCRVVTTTSLLPAKAREDVAQAGHRAVAALSHADALRERAVRLVRGVERERAIDRACRFFALAPGEERRRQDRERARRFAFELARTARAEERR